MSQFCKVLSKYRVWFSARYKKGKSQRSMEVQCLTLSPWVRRITEGDRYTCIMLGGNCDILIQKVWGWMLKIWTFNRFILRIFECLRTKYFTIRNTLIFTSFSTYLQNFLWFHYFIYISDSFDSRAVSSICPVRIAERKSDRLDTLVVKMLNGHVALDKSLHHLKS